MSASLPPPPLSVEAVAKRYGCSARHIRAMVAAGELPCLRLGKLLRFPLDALIAFEASACPQPLPATPPHVAQEQPSPQTLPPDNREASRKALQDSVRMARIARTLNRAAARSE